ncbi:MAG: ExbD/TolR family protein [Phycisphaerales bacterium]
MNFLRHRKPPMPAPRLPLIALIDVVLFILLYFIIAGTFGGDESDLAATLTADRAAGGSGSKLSAQVLNVETSGGLVRFRLGSRVMTDRAALTSVVGSLPKEPGLVVRVANDVPVGAAAAALQAAHDAGFTRISYVPAR